MLNCSNVIFMYFIMSTPVGNAWEYMYQGFHQTFQFRHILGDYFCLVFVFLCSTQQEILIGSRLSKTLFYFDKFWKLQLLCCKREVSVSQNLSGKRCCFLFIECPKMTVLLYVLLVGSRYLIGIYVGSQVGLLLRPRYHCERHQMVIDDSRKQVLKRFHGIGHGEFDQQVDIHDIIILFML